MSDNTTKSGHTSHEPKKDDCCGGTPAKDQKAQADQKEKSNPTAEHKHEHAHQSKGSSGCCGGSKANK